LRFFKPESELVDLVCIVIVEAVGIFVEWRFCLYLCKDRLILLLGFWGVAFEK